MIVDNNNKHRKIQHRNKYIIFITLGIVILIFTFWLIYISINNKNMLNLLWIIMIFLSIFVLLFPVYVFVNGVFNVFGSTIFVFTNSKYYSCVSSNVKNEIPTKITIQIPVYKEDFDFVIKYTLLSSIACREYYQNNNMHQIIVNIIVHDDGLQVIDDFEKNKRIDFYKTHNIGYIGRPKENRNGRFKKASNLNFGFNILNNHNYDITNALIGGELYLGEYVLLLDADTRIPFDCLHDPLYEFQQDDKLGFIQHLSFALITTNTYWEKFINHFTEMIYETGILISCAGGDCSPFVGHNGMIRTEVFEKIKSKDNNSMFQIWSEEHVSEDFIFFIKAIKNGYYGRYITYCNNRNNQMNNFLEGKSLSYDDELLKFKKYAYGSCEILFNPFNKWLLKSPIGEFILLYLTSDIEFTSKIGILSYLFTYVAIGLSFPFAYLNYILYGLFEKETYNDILPLHIIIQVMLLFSIFGTLTNSILKGRILKKDIINIIWENIKYIPYYVLFFGSLPYHIFFMMINFFIGSKNINWRSTQKEIIYESKYQSIKNTLYLYRYMFVLYISTFIILILSCSNIIKIQNVNAIVPLFTNCIFSLVSPFLLNPYIMTNNKFKKISTNENHAK